MNKFKFRELPQRYRYDINPVFHIFLFSEEFKSRTMISFFKMTLVFACVGLGSASKKHKTGNHRTDFDIYIFTMHWPYTTCMEWESGRGHQCADIGNFTSSTSVNFITSTFTRQGGVECSRTLADSIWRNQPELLQQLVALPAPGDGAHHDRAGAVLA